jgi:enamine deaminase RidA (YjgF/YER057c/UK114 family)
VPAQVFLPEFAKPDPRLARKSAAGNMNPRSKQVTNLFTHVRTAIQQAGGTPDDIIKMTFWMTDPTTGRAALNDEWLKMFPDVASRPARHTMALGPESNALVTCEFVAVFG